MLICGLGGLEKAALVAAGDKEACCNRERTVYQGCNSRGAFSKLSNFPFSTMWKWTSTDLEVLVHFHIVERGKLESLENIPNFSKHFRGLKRPLHTCNDHRMEKKKAMTAERSKRKLLRWKQETECGYFLSIAKCVLVPTTRLLFLGIICDTEARRFDVPEGKLFKLEVLLTAVITSGWTSLVDLERLVGKCTSMSFAVPPASLYTYHIYKHIAKFRRTRGSLKKAMIAVQKGRGLSDEFRTWREVRHRMNGAS